MEPGRPRRCSIARDSGGRLSLHNGDRPRKSVLTRTQQIPISPGMIFLGIAYRAVLCLQVLAADPTAPGPAGLLQPAQPVHGVALLRNGHSIEGDITRDDGVVTIDFSGGQVRVRDAEVEHVCGSLLEGYQWKRSLIQVGNVHHHLELAQWALRNGLPGPAAVELADATAADPKHPMIAHLQRRLKMALEPPPTGRADAAAHGPTNEELDRMVRGLPQGTVEMFTQHVQPVLMNHCATSGCHGPQSGSEMQLLRTTSGRQAGRRLTQRNLYAVLQFVDRENPMQSRLLTAPNGPHGTAEYAIFSERQAAQYKHLIDWVARLGREPLANRPTPRTPRASTPADAPDAVVPASFDQPADPFDPEAFNRVYAPKQPKAKN